MKNKTTTYALLGVVLLIWGYISYKIYSGIKGDDIVIPQTSTISKLKDTTKTVDENYELILNYRDPFLNKLKQTEPLLNSIQRPKINTVNSGKVVKTKPVVIQEPIHWETIVFKGCIKNPTTNKTIAMVQFENMQHMLAEGSEIKGLKLLKIYRDSIKVTYKNVSKTLLK